jgi:hypothetical protein
MNEDKAARAAQESINNTMATGAETVRGVQERFTSAVGNARDLNLTLIDMAQANTQARSILLAKSQKPRGLRIVSRLGPRTRLNNLTC